MRLYFNKKAVQVMTQNQDIFGEFMPSKLFKDLFEFFNKL